MSLPPRLLKPREPIFMRLHPRPSPRSTWYPNRQRGVTLIELMVGLAIGLMVIAVALGALMASRGVSGTVSDASGIQQQGAYVLRLIGQQLRQTGSLYLNPDPAKSGSSNEVLSAVAFEIRAAAVGNGNAFAPENTLRGGTDKLTTGFRRYQDSVFMASGTAATESTPAVSGVDYLARNCLAAPANNSADQLIESIFTFANESLLCQGNGATRQPIAQNVAQFQVTYLVQDPLGTTVQYTAGSDMPTTPDPLWGRVRGVQVCLVLYGSEPIDMPAGSSYTDCEGNSVDMTALADADVHRRNRMHLLFRNTFQLRSQGLL